MPWQSERRRMSDGGQDDTCHRRVGEQGGGGGGDGTGEERGWDESGGRGGGGGGGDAAGMGLAAADGDMVGGDGGVRRNSRRRTANETSGVGLTVSISGHAPGKIAGKQSPAEERTGRIRVALALVVVSCILGVANLLRSAWVQHGKFQQNIRSHVPTLLPLVCGAVLCALGLNSKRGSTTARSAAARKYEHRIRLALRFFPLCIAIHNTVCCPCVSERPEIAVDAGTYTSTLCGGAILSVAVHALLRSPLSEISRLLAFMGVYAVLLWWHHDTTLFGVAHVLEVLAVCFVLFVAYATVCWRHWRQTRMRVDAARELHFYAAQRTPSPLERAKQPV